MKGTKRTVLVLAAAVVVAGAGWSVADEPAQSKEPRSRPRRLYFGSPPTIPHEAGGDFSECLLCHEAGSVGPETPHPIQERCRQCHVESQTETDFRANSFTGLPLPEERSKKVQPNGPRLMPHPVKLREKCLACHSPDSGKDVLATTHPERERCRQCHVPQQWNAEPLPH